MLKKVVKILNDRLKTHFLTKLDEYNELIFNHFPVEADLFGGSQNFYYNFYNFKFFIVNSSILIDNNVEFETISFDPITLVAVAKFKLLLKK